VPLTPPVSTLRENPPARDQFLDDASHLLVRCVARRKPFPRVWGHRSATIAAEREPTEPLLTHGLLCGDTARATEVRRGGQAGPPQETAGRMRSTAHWICLAFTQSPPVTKSWTASSGLNASAATYSQH